MIPQHSGNPLLAFATAQKRVKGEDRVLLSPSVALPSGETFSLFGVFDGHGGRQTAELCVQQFVPVLLQQLARLS